MELTLAGNILLASLFLITLIGTFVWFIKDTSLDNESNLFKTVTAIATLFFSSASAGLVLLVTNLLIICSYKTTDNFHTIYSNQQNAKVFFKTDLDGAEFISGQQIKNVSLNKRGILTLSKDGVKIKKDVYKTEYVGDNEVGSIVEKIEYSNDKWETKLFGISLAKSTNHHALKIYLKKTTEKSAKDEKDAKIKKELNSILESSK